MVRLSITLTAACARDAENLLEGLDFLIPGTRLTRGCIACYAWADADSVVHYLEDWATEGDIRRRVLSEAFTPLMALVEVAGDAHVEFHFVSQTRGLDYVTEMRQRAANQPES